MGRRRWQQTPVAEAGAADIGGVDSLRSQLYSLVFSGQRGQGNSKFKRQKKQKRQSLPFFLDRTGEPETADAAEDAERSEQKQQKQKKPKKKKNQKQQQHEAQLNDEAKNEQRQLDDQESQRQLDDQESQRQLEDQEHQQQLDDQEQQRQLDDQEVQRQPDDQERQRQLEDQERAGDSAGLQRQVGRAKRRVLAALRRLAKPGRPDASLAGGEPADSRRDVADVGGGGREACFTQVINDTREADSSDDDGDRVASALAVGVDDDGDVSQEISLGVKNDSHHAPAFIETHSGHLAVFLASMRSDPALWQVDAADTATADATAAGRRFGAGQRRYFDAASAADEMLAECDVCKKRGHYTIDCKRGGQVCVLCSAEGHHRSQCPKRLCQFCLAEGHRPERCGGQRGRDSAAVRCGRCRRLGHGRSLCPDNWRQYHATVSPGCPQKPRKRQWREWRQPATTGVVGFDMPPVADVSRLCDLPYCCNCAAAGHSVHECKQPRSWLNRCFGSFYSQKISTYDSVDPFANRRTQLTAPPTSSSAVEAAVAENSSTTPGISASAGIGDSRRPSGRAGEDFISIRQHPALPALPRVAVDYNYGDGDEDDNDDNNGDDAAVAPSAGGKFSLLASAKQLLPTGASRSQIRQFAKRLRYWRRHGYRPTTPEEAVVHDRRMEEWLLRVADSHDCLHRMNFRSRCRLMNSTGATLQMIRSRKYGDPQQQQQQEQKKKQKQKQQQKQQQQQSPSSSQWAGRLRTRSQSSAEEATAKTENGEKGKRRRKQRQSAAAVAS